MAGQDGRESIALETELLENGNTFSYVQAVRLLRLLIRQRAGEDLDAGALNSAIRTRPELSLNFPQADISAIDRISEKPLHYLITATFMGLYGVSSPLPTFYTEDLLQENLQDYSASRGLIDIINSRFYDIFFHVWGRHRLLFKLIEDPSHAYLQRLYCLLGPESEKLRQGIDDAHGLLRYLGLSLQFPRSAEGLRVLISDYLAEKRISIEQCVLRVVAIPRDQRFSLGKAGNLLGESAYLGEQFTDMTGKFRVHIGAVGAEKFQELLPDKPAFQRISQLVRFYADQSLLWDMKLDVDNHEVQTARLGESAWSRLGWDTWMFSGKMPEKEAAAMFLPAEN